MDRCAMMMIVHPEARWGGLVEGMTDAQLAVMRGPDRDAAASNVPRLHVEEDGAIDVIYAKGQTLYSDATPTGPVAKQAAVTPLTTVNAKL